MKFISSVAFMGALCTKRASSYISSIPPFGAANPNWKKTSFAQPPANVDVDDVFRDEYHAWAKHYGKETNEFRFQNFKLNYMLQMQHNKKTKTFNELNEYGDCKLLIPFFQQELSLTIDFHCLSKTLIQDLTTLFLFYCSDRKRIRNWKG